MNKDLESLETELKHVKEILRDLVESHGIMEIDRSSAASLKKEVESLERTIKRLKEK